MTPLIDVMLVLLVIFIITAPLMTSSLKLDLPKASGHADRAPAFIALAINADGSLFFGDEPLDRDALAQRVAAGRPGATGNSKCSCALTRKCLMAGG